MNFTSVTGHLMEVEFEENNKKWILEKTIDLFETKIEKIILDNKQPIAENLLSLGKKADLLILWLDCDREGENIAFEVVDTVKSVNPSIKILRARFSALTPKDIEKAIGNLENPNKNLSDAVDCRQRIDLIIGAAFTRLQTLSFRDFFNIKNQNNYASVNVVSYGPCQFPTLNFVVERAEQIEKFSTENFYYLELKLHETQFQWNRHRLFDESVVKTLYEKVLSSGYAKIESRETKPMVRYRPIPLNTVEFQKLASRKLKISPHYSMNIAEFLYQNGYISYPRTETQKYAYSEIPKLKRILQEIAQGNDYSWSTYAKEIEFKKPRDGKNDDKAHPPIHPVKYAESNSLEGNYKKIYELIVTHFLATVSEDATGEETTIEVSSGGEYFNARGITLKNRGFLNVYSNDFLIEKELPNLNVGQKFKFGEDKKSAGMSSVEFQVGTTTPPNFLSEAELITLMDKHGIGTDSTIHEHLRTIKERGYTSLMGNKFIPTSAGLALIKAYRKIGIEIFKPYLRAQMEREITDIASGKKDYETTLENMKKEMLKIYQQVYSKIPIMVDFIKDYLKVEQVESTSNETSQNKSKFMTKLNCPKCEDSKMKLFLNKSKKTYFLGCASFPKCDKIISINNPKNVTKEQELCENCETNLYKLDFSHDKSINICLESCLIRSYSKDPDTKTSIYNNKKNLRNKESSKYVKKSNSVRKSENISQKKEKKVCPLCNAVGRHQKNSDCQGILVYKNENKGDYID